MTILPKKKQAPKEPRSAPPSASDHPLAGAAEFVIANQDGGSDSASAVAPSSRKASYLHFSTADGDASFASAHRKRLSTGSVRQDRRVKTKPNPLLPSTSSADVQQQQQQEACNSEDELERCLETHDYTEELEKKFEEKLKQSKGFLIKKMEADGACLFRAVADQVYGDEDMHGVVRKLCMDYLAKNSDYFSQFVTENFQNYIRRKRVETAHGNHIEMQALAELFNRPIEVYQYGTEPINTFHSNHKTDNPPIRLSYHREIHYNSVIDPYAATIGIGLGLPQFFPGLAEKNLMCDALRASEQDVIEQTMLHDKLKATDWEATDQEIQEQNGDSNLPLDVADPVKAMQNEQDFPANLLKASSSTCQLDQLNVWETDDDILNRVLAISRQEYYNSLKKQMDESDEAAGCSTDGSDSRPASSANQGTSTSERNFS